MLKVETSFKLPKEFSNTGKVATLAQAIHVYRDRSHFGLRKAQTRSEVNRTTKKLYKQKGTGGARHGARSAPIFVGGGKAHGPRPLKRELKLSEALKKSALSAALSVKNKEAKVFVVSGFSTVKTTKEVALVLKKADSSAKRFVVALASTNMEKAKFVKNIAGAVVLLYSGLNALQVVLGGTLILDSAIFAAEKPAKKVVVKKGTQEK